MMHDQSQTLLKYNLSIPNLPGYTPKSDTWIKRQQDGFGRLEFMSRPNSAMGTRIPASPTKFEVSYEGFNNQQRDVKPILRPSTAGYARNTGMPTSKSALALTSTFSRPTSAGMTRPISMEYLHSRPDPSLQKAPQHPKYVSMDKKVLRFFGHFYQDRLWEVDGPLGDPMVETRMARRLTIMYHLVNDTVEINETKEINSGVVAGSFFKRGILEKDSGAPLTPYDLSVGKTVRALGLEIFITDGDAFTRDYYSNVMAIEQGPALSRPPIVRQDIGAQYATGMGSVSSPSHQFHGTCSTDYLTLKEELDKTNAFLKYDGKIVRFQCVEVQSPYPPYFPQFYEDGTLDPSVTVASDNAKKFALSFFLSDGKVELVVQKTKPKFGAHEATASYDEPRLLLKKSKLPKDWRRAKAGQPTEFYDAPDFHCGSVVDVFGRHFLLVKCDAFTKNFFREMGVTQREVPLMKEESEPLVHEIPQLGDGFLPIGGPEDTLGTVYGQPKYRPDIAKRTRNSQRTLRCKAIMLADNEIDASREFMITYYMEDDTVQVFEDCKRNSGITGGNFLKRGKYINLLPSDAEEPRHFKPTDIFIGNIVSFNGFEMQIIELDNLSLRFCENYPDEFPMNDTFRIIGSILNAVVRFGLDLRTVFRAADTKRVGSLSQDAFIEVLEANNLIDELNDQELLTLLRRFKDGDQFHYTELCDLMSHIYADSYLSSKPHTTPKRHVPVDVRDFDGFLRTARARTTQWRRTMRKEPHTLHGCCTLAVLANLFRKHGLVLKDSLLSDLFQKFCVPIDKATPILQELSRNNATTDIYDALQQKVEPMRGTSHLNRVKKLKDSRGQGRLTNGSILLPVKARGPRKNSINMIPSILRGNASRSHSHDMSAVLNYADILVDFNTLCDEIYISDWANDD